MSLLTNVLKLWRTGQYLLPADSGFSPKHLLAGRVGWWLDPLDFRYAWQDSAGTTPYTAVEQYVGKIVDKSPNALAFTQATSVARPVVSARVNFRLSSQTASGLTATSVSTAPISVPGFDGFTSGFSVKETATGGAHHLSNLTTVPGTKRRMAHIVKDAGRSVVSIADAGINQTIFDLSTKTISGFGVSQAKITELHDGFFLIESTRTWTYTSSYLILYSGGVTSYTGDPAKGVDIAGMDVRYDANAKLPYQWSNSPTDYATAGFPNYLKFDSIDDNLVSAAGGGGAAGIYFCGAIQFNKVGAVQTIFSDAGTNSGYKLRLTAANQLEISAGNGTAYTAINTTDTFAVGDVALCEFWDDGTNIGVRLGEGTLVTVARPVVTAGTAQITLGKANNAASEYSGVSIFSAVYLKDYCPTAAERADYKR